MTHQKINWDEFTIYAHTLGWQLRDYNLEAVAGTARIDIALELYNRNIGEFISLPPMLITDLG